METFEIGRTWTMHELMKKYHFVSPVLFSIVLGHEGEAPAAPQASAAMIQMIPEGALWGITHARRKDFSLIAGALGMGAKTVRLLHAMDKEPMTPDEARAYFRIKK